MSIFFKIHKKYDALPLVAKASFWFLLCSFLQKGIAVISTPIFTRLMTPAEFGSYSVFTSWQTILSVVITLNLYGGVYVQGIIKYSEKRNKFSSSVQGLTLTLVTVWLIIYFLFPTYWNRLLSLNTLQVCCMLLLIWLSAVFSFWSAEQRVLNKYSTLIIVSIAFSFFSTILGIALVILSEDKVLARIFSLVIIQLILYSALFLSQMQKGKCFFDWAIWKYVLLFNLPLIPHYLSMVLLNTVDKIMIERMIGVTESGLYSLAFSIGLLMTLFNTALTQTVEPWLYKKIKSSDYGGISEVSNLLFMFVATVNLYLIAFAPEIIKIFAPAEYYEAVWIIPPVAMSSFFMFTYTFFAVFEFYYEKTFYIVIATVTGAVCKIAINYFLIPKYGYFAAGYSTLLCYFLYAGLHFYFMTRVCKQYINNLKIYSLKFLVLSSGSFVMLGLILLWSYQNILVRCFFIFLSFLFIARNFKKVLATISKIISLRQKSI